MFVNVTIKNKKTGEVIDTDENGVQEKRLFQKYSEKASIFKQKYGIK